jgi:hypothetical protein
MNIFPILNSAEARNRYITSVYRNLYTIRYLFPKGSRVSKNKRLLQDQFLKRFPKRRYVIGSLVEGVYGNWQDVRNPVVLILGCYLKSIVSPKGPGPVRDYVEGICLNYLNSDELRILKTFIFEANKPLQSNGRFVALNGSQAFNFLKIQFPSIIQHGYRSYHSEFTSFKTISRGFFPTIIPIYKTGNTRFIIYINSINSVLNKSPLNFTEVVNKEEQLNNNMNKVLTNYGMK